MHLFGEKTLTDHQYLFELQVSLYYGRGSTHKMSKCKAVLIGTFLNLIDLQESLKVLAPTCAYLVEALTIHLSPIEL